LEACLAVLVLNRYFVYWLGHDIYANTQHDFFIRKRHEFLKDHLYSFGVLLMPMAHWYYFFVSRVCSMSSSQFDL
jgi:hypothetical protein